MRRRYVVLIWSAILVIAVAAFLTLDAALDWCVWTDCWRDVAS